MVLSDQFSVATYHHAVGGFCAGGLATPKINNGCYFEVEILEVDERWVSAPPLLALRLGRESRRTARGSGKIHVGGTVRS